MFAEEIRRAVEAAPREKLPEVAALLWRAVTAGQVSEAEAEGLSELIEIRRGVSRLSRPVEERPSEAPDPPGGGAGRQDAPERARSRAGSRPRSEASLERRRRWAASGRLPPGIAARFTLAEQAVLALVAAETARRKDCRLAVGNIAAVVGVSETTVRNALREARQLGLLTVEERPITAWRNDTNVVRIESREWLAWLRLARTDPPRSRPLAAAEGGGCKSADPTPTHVHLDRPNRAAEAAERAAGRRKAGPTAPRSRPSRFAAGGPRRV